MQTACVDARARVVHNQVFQGLSIKLTSWRNGSAFDSRSKGWGFDSLRGHMMFCRIFLWFIFLTKMQLAIFFSIWSAVGVVSFQHSPIAFSSPHLNHRSRHHSCFLSSMCSRNSRKSRGFTLRVQASEATAVEADGKQSSCHQVTSSNPSLIPQRLLSRRFAIPAIFVAGQSLAQSPIWAFELKQESFDAGSRLNIPAQWQRYPAPELRGATFADPVAGQTLRYLSVTARPTDAAALSDLGVQTASSL